MVKGGKRREEGRLLGSGRTRGHSDPRANRTIAQEDRLQQAVQQSKANMQTTMQERTAKIEQTIEQMPKSGGSLVGSRLLSAAALLRVSWRTPSLEWFSYRKRLWRPIPAVAEEAAGVLDRDRRQRPVCGFEERPSRPRLRPPQQALDLGEGFLYGVEVRRVGREEQNLGPLLLDQLPHPGASTHGEVIHHHDLPAF